MYGKSWSLLLIINSSLISYSNKSQISWKIQRHLRESNKSIYEVPVGTSVLPYNRKKLKNYLPDKKFHLIQCTVHCIEIWQYKILSLLNATIIDCAPIMESKSCRDRSMSAVLGCTARSSRSTSVRRPASFRTAAASSSAAGPSARNHFSCVMVCYVMSCLLVSGLWHFTFTKRVDVMTTNTSVRTLADRTEQNVPRLLAL